MASLPPFHLDLTATDHATPVVQRLTQANQRLSQSVDNVGGFFTRNRRPMQQFGFQAADIAVQIGGGQSAMLAFTQNGTQFLQFFGSAGAIIGAGVAILGSLAIALTKSGVLTISTASAMKRLSEHTDEAVASFKELDNVQKTIGDLEQLPINSTIDALLRLNRSFEGNALDQIREDLDLTTKALNDVARTEGGLTRLGAFWERFKIALGSTDIFKDTLELGKLQQQAQRTTGAMQELTVALKYDNANLIIDRYLRLTGLIEALGDEGKETAEALKLLTPLIVTRLDTIGATVEKEKELRETIEKNRKVLSDTLTIAKDLLSTSVERVKVAGQQATAYNTQKAQIVALYNTTSGLLHLERQRAKEAKAAQVAYETQSLYYSQRFRDEEELMSQPVTPRDIETIELFTKKLTAAGGAIGGAGGVTEQVMELTYELTQAGKEAETLANSISATIGSELLSMSDRTKTVADAFRTMARDIIKQLYDVLVIQRLVGSWSIDSKTGTGSGSGLMGLLMQGIGGLFGGAKLATPSYAGGGYTGGGGRAGGLDGKGGFAALLHPNETVIDHTKGGEASVVQNITINAMSDGDIDRVLAKRMPQLKNAVLGAVRNERRRGALA